MYHVQLTKMTEEVLNDFGNLSLEQLNRKSSDKNWSVGQCLDHLIKTNEQYLHKLNAVSSKDYKMSFWERINPLTDYTGQNLIRSLGEFVTKKYINPRLFAPSSGTIRHDIVMVFANHQEKLKILFREIEEGQHLQKVISSPVAPLITLRVKDVLVLIIEHEKRHIKQANRAMNSN